MNQHANVTAAPLMTDSSLTNDYVRVLFTRVICFALLRYTIRLTKEFAPRLIQAETEHFWVLIGLLDCLCSFWLGRVITWFWFYETRLKTLNAAIKCHQHKHRHARRARYQRLGVVDNALTYIELVLRHATYQTIMLKTQLTGGRRKTSWLFTNMPKDLN